MSLKHPSPWLEHRENKAPQPCKQASFVEYLRWMRIQQENPNDNSLISTENNGTLLEIFDCFADNDFSDALRRLTERTKRLADHWFRVKCDWRIRVGGAKGPESMLLPAFDALGMPYLPSSTLKGVARAIATRQATRSQDGTVTLEQVRAIFGDISQPHPCTGQIIFLDAYPLPGEDLQGGLMPDMTNALWTWQDDRMPEYKANPNPFLSLEEPIFLIGLRSRPEVPKDTLIQVKRWLLTGLIRGIGARVNSGYGLLKQFDDNSETIKVTQEKLILQVGFQLQGQLIHGAQNFVGWEKNRTGDKWKPPGTPQSEVRPTAFRSMLRYWFRTLALGQLDAARVRRLEMEIFGGIKPPPARTGLFRLTISGGKICQDTASEVDDDYGLAKGKLILCHSSQTRQLDSQKQAALISLLQCLTWLMFHFGGIGQGARRPCYSRQNRGKPPWWRGTTLIAKSNREDWQLPPSLQQFQRRFRQRLKTFYKTLEAFSGEQQSLRTVAAQTGWSEVIDRQCVIVCVEGRTRNEKSFALSVLHQEAWRNGSYDPLLCGSTQRPSPIWIARIGTYELGCYEVVTVFGATDKRRSNYLTKLKPENNRAAIAVLPIWPLE